MPWRADSAAPAISSIDATSSTPPMTRAEKTPPGANRPGKPSDAAQGSSLPSKMYTVSGEPVNLKNSDWMKTSATYTVSSQWPFRLSQFIADLPNGRGSLLQQGRELGIG